MLAGCSDAPTEPEHIAAPIIESAVALASTPNVLSAALSVRVRHADSVVVRIEPASDDNRTAAVVPASDTLTIPVLGLRPTQQYDLRPIAYGRGGVTVGEPVPVTTGALPPDLPRYTAGGVDPAPGYVVFAAGIYGVVIDNTGRVVWYHRFATGVGLSFMAQPNGRYVAKPPTPVPGDVEPWIEIDPLGRVTRALGCAHGLSSRLHDLIGLPDGSYWIMCDESRTMDLTPYGGAADARVIGTVVQHLAIDGAPLFEWSPFDHFAITDVEESERRGSNVNWTHGNSIDLDSDGNLLVSFRNLSEVTKIDTRTGAVIWRLGGRRNQLTFLDTPAPAFAHQHGVRDMGAGTFVILDNIGNASESRAERYVVNEMARTARLAHSYGSIPGVTTHIGGSVQPLAGGRTLVSFGTEGRVEEYDAQGRLTWSIQGNAGYVFRAQRIRSLYAPGVGTAR
ncbi:MAG TPA: arylsulfotransferase family protein [Gemmatimonadaceae bacterium]|nr:arylsulfotransferase family protein [Gemmatimonadaceae bacterium]